LTAGHSWRLFSKKAFAQPLSHQPLWFIRHMLLYSWIWLYDHKTSVKVSSSRQSPLPWQLSWCTLAALHRPHHDPCRVVMLISNISRSPAAATSRRCLLHYIGVVTAFTKAVEWCLYPVLWSNWNTSIWNTYLKYTACNLYLIPCRNVFCISNTHLTVTRILNTIWAQPYFSLHSLLQPWGE